MLSPTLASLRTALAPLFVLGGTNPINADGTVQVTLADILAAAGVSDLNQLPAGTNLLQYVPARSRRQGDEHRQRTPIGNLSLVPGLLATLTNTVQPALGTAIDALAQLNVNVKTNGADGAFTRRRSASAC